MYVKTSIRCLQNIIGRKQILDMQVQKKQGKEKQRMKELERQREEQCHKQVLEDVERKKERERREAEHEKRIKQEVIL